MSDGPQVRVDAGHYLADALPGLLAFSLGLSLTVAPLTATVLGSIDQRHAGVASGVNNAIARVAGLVAIAVVGAAVSAQFARSLDEEVAGRELPATARAELQRVNARALTDAGGDALARAGLEEPWRRRPSRAFGLVSSAG